MAAPHNIAARLERVEALLRLLGAGSSTTSFGNAATLQGHPASYFAVAGAGSALTEESAAPPAASAGNVGTLYMRRSGSGQPTQLLLCGQTSTDGVYEWGILWQSS